MANTTITSSLRPASRGVKNPGSLAVTKISDLKYEGSALGGNVKVEATSEIGALSALRKATHEYLNEPSNLKTLA